MIGLGFLAIAVLTTVLLSIAIRKKWLNLRVGILLNSVLAAICFALAEMSLTGSVGASICMIVMGVPTLDLALVFGLKYSSSVSNKSA